MMSDNSDPDIQLFAKRRKIYPRAVSGIFRQRKWVLMAVCLAIYYLAPFIRWDRGPYAPDQAILIDMAGRRAYWFFIEIWPQEVYYFTAILIFAAVAMFFVTSLFGRVWCGYFCFQTVWTDLFLWVERIVQGDRAERIKLDAAPWGMRKLFKKTTTHVAWLGIALLTGGAFVLYFNDAPTLLGQLFTTGLSPTVTAFVIGLTASTYVMAGLAREQVCTYMCPYARFQSAMFDEDSLVIAYDQQRGEPRGKHKKGESWEGRGHCVDCTQCVQVCPTGIDIRDGLQIQCIACGLCIDACDSVMDKVGLPRGLIRYDTERNLKAQQPGVIVTKSTHLHLLRPRTFLYIFALLVVGAGLLTAMLTRHPLELHVLHDRNPLFVLESDGRIRNGYDVNILNMSLNNQSYALEVQGIAEAEVELRTPGQPNLQNLQIPANDSRHVRIFVTAPAPSEPSVAVRFILTPNDGSKPVEVDSIFVSKE